MGALITIDVLVVVPDEVERSRVVLTDGLSEAVSFPLDARMIQTTRNDTQTKMVTPISC